MDPNLPPNQHEPPIGSVDLTTANKLISPKQTNCSVTTKFSDGVDREQGNSNASQTNPVAGLTNEINLETGNEATPTIHLQNGLSDDADNPLPTDDQFLPNLPASPYLLQNPINHLTSLLLSSERDRPKRVTLNVGGVKHEVGIVK